mmetsp:Transcript_41600/g.83416  ORF Transcript_41600/g.83416 Transcript_41600/m.83416 type:complete len:164 (+) Transcript_41600:854-1345(+)
MRPCTQVLISGPQERGQQPLSSGQGQEHAEVGRSFHAEGTHTRIYALSCSSIERRWELGKIAANVCKAWNNVSVSVRELGTGKVCACLIIQMEWRSSAAIHEWSDGERSSASYTYMATKDVKKATSLVKEVAAAIRAFTVGSNREQANWLAGKPTPASRRKSY